MAETIIAGKDSSSPSLQAWTSSQSPFPSQVAAARVIPPRWTPLWYVPLDLPTFSTFFLGPLPSLHQPLSRAEESTYPQKIQGAGLGLQHPDPPGHNLTSTVSSMCAPRQERHGGGGGLGLQLLCYEIKSACVAMCVCVFCVWQRGNLGIYVN